MKSLIKILILALVLLGLISCTSRPSDPEGVMKSFIKAFNENNTEAALSFLSDNVAALLNN